MALSLINSFNVGDNATLQLGGASYVTTAVVGGTTYVFVTGKGGGDNGVSVFSLGDDGTLTNVFNVGDNNTTNLGGAFALTTAVVGDTTYLFVCGVNDSGVSVFSVGADGSLTNTANVGDGATLKLSLSVDVETMVVGGTTYLFADGVNDNGVSVFAVGANGTLTNVDNVTDDGTSRIQGPQGMATATVDGHAYLFVTGFHDDGVGVYSVAADGHLTNVFNVSDSGPMELDGPVDAITVAVGGTTYLVVSGFEDDGLTVFSVAADGHLTNVFNLPDDGTLKLDNPVGLSTTVIGGTTYLLVAGADDDGLSVFAMDADGALTNVANVSDDSTLLLDRALGVTTVTINGQTYAIVGSNNDSGVSVFKLVDDAVIDTNHEPTLIATGNNPTFTEGGAAADLYSAPLASTIEQGQTFTSLTLTVTNVTDGADEILSFLGHDLALTDGNSVAGVTVSVAGTTATVTFPGAADAAALQALVDGLAYRNASENPTEADRVITITRLVDSGGTAGGGDDTAALDIVSTVHVHGTNDAAVITGDTAGNVTEAGAANNGTSAATGNLDSTDVDNTADAWQAVVAGAATANGFGTYALSADGHWTYTLDNANAAVQALNGAATLIDTFNAVTADGTAQLVTVTIHAQNDAAVITGDAAGAVSEAGINNGTPTATGNLDAADFDNTADAWQAVAAGAASVQGFGTFALSADGHWTYTLDNNNAAVQFLNATSTPLVDTFTVRTQDGTAQVVTVTITGANDAATITGDAAGNVTEAGVANNGTPTATGNLDAADVDNTADAWQVVAAGAATANGYGTYALAANGVWTYTLDNTNAAVQALNGAATLIDTFNAVTADGTTQLVTVTIHAQNDAAVITGTAAGNVTEAGVANNGTPTATGNLDATDVDNTADAWSVVAPGTGTIGGFGTYAVTADGHWTYTLDNNNAAVQALNGAATLTDTFNAVTADGTAQLVTITIHAQNDAAVITGDAAGAVTRSAGVTPTDSGDLNAADPDNAPDAWQAVATGAATANGYGTYALAANGVWTYTLDNANPAVEALKAADTLTDTFTVLTADGTAQIVTVTISAQNDAPAIDLNGAGAGTGSAAAFTEGGAPTPIVDISPTVSDANDAQLQSATIVLTDAQAGDVLSVGDLSPFGITSTIDTGVAGRVTVTLTGASMLANYRAALKHVTFSNASENPSALDRHIEVSVNDGQLQSNTAIATVTVTPVNDAPLAQNGAASGNEDNVINGALAATDVDSASLTYSRVAQAAHGTVTVNANGTFSYTPNAGFHGSDSFTFKANDGLADSNVATINITVNPVDDAPAIVSNGGGDAAAVSVPEDTTAITTVHATDSDSAVITYSISGGSDAAKFQINALSGALSFINAPNFEAPGDADHNNSYVVQVRASDGSLSDEQTITVDVTNVVEQSKGQDFNADGKSDILLQNDNGTPAVWLMDGVNVTAMGALPNPGASWTATDTGDFNGDGKADILWQNDDGTPAVWLMDGTNVLSFGPALPNPGASWHAKEAADFNGDGKADILWQNDDGAAAVWLMNGTSVESFGPALANPGPTWHVQDAADFNGDGKADILWQNNDGTPAVWLMNGTSVDSFGPALANPGPSWHAAAAGDFNADGKADILWQNDDGTPAVWLMDGTHVLSFGPALPNPGASWHVEEAADANGDGKADIIWQNDNGTPAVWLMDGTSLLEAGGALTNLGSAWHLV